MPIATFDRFRRRMSSQGRQGSSAKASAQQAQTNAEKPHTNAEMNESSVSDAIFPK